MVWREYRKFRFTLTYILLSPVLALILSAPLYANGRAPTQGSSIQAYDSAGETGGIWIAREEIMELSLTGPAWERMSEAANSPVGMPDLSDQNEDTNVIVLAKAIVFVRTNNSAYRSEVADALRIITYNNTEDGGETLALGRKLAAYIIAADLIDLTAYDPGLDAAFRVKLRELLTKDLFGYTLVSTHETRPNNWGTHAGASRAAAAAYLGDTAELARTAQVFKGWLGDRSSYTGFEFGDLSWQCDPNNPVGVNPKGCIKDGHLIDGALPDEMRRGGPFTWPPIETGYPWEGLQGAVVQAEILHRAGYPAWEWEDQTLLRAVQFLYDIGWDAEADDRWQIWLINHAYGLWFDVERGVSPGKNMAWTDWSHWRPGYFFFIPGVRKTP